MISIEHLRSNTTIPARSSEIFFENVKEKIINRIHEVILKVDNELNLSGKVSDYKLVVEFPKSSRYLGRAGIKFNTSLKKYELKIELNKNALEEKFEHMMEDVIPHEVAHLVCYVNYHVKGYKVKPHGKEWKAICSRLGGRPAAISKEKYSTLESAKKRAIYRYVYTLDDGSKVMIPGPTHKKIQLGKLYSTRSKTTGKSFTIWRKNFEGKVKVN